MKIIKNANLSELLWYKIGGKAEYVLECSSEEDVLEAVSFIREEKIKKHFVVGLGSNLLFTDEDYEGAIIKLVSNTKPKIILSGKDVVEGFAGETLDSVIQFSFDNNLIGLEWAGGLPGTIGAAVRGNVGAFGGEISKQFYSARVIDISEKKITLRNLNRRDIKFSYRTSTIKKNPQMIVVSASFKLKKVDEATVGRARTTYFSNIEYRKNKHPLEFPSTGSAFKNISEPENVKKVLDTFPDLEKEVRIKWHGKVSVGYLNKRLDLSGLKIGNAQISNKHSNFIVNLGGASFHDVYSIITKIQETYQDEFGFSPEPEVEIVK